MVLCLQVLYAILFFRFLRPIMAEVIKKAPDLDERQLSVRNAAHYHAYQILRIVLVTITVAPLAADLYAGVSLPLSLTSWHFQGLFFFYANLTISLPASVVAWTEPDPSPDD